MATFYSRIQGNRGEATRCGSKDSGVRAEVSTFGNIITTREYTTSYTGDSASGKLASIEVRGGLSTGGGTVLHVSFDADSLIQVSDDEDVQNALQAVRDAFDTLDVVVKSVVEEERVERENHVNPALAQEEAAQRHRDSLA